MNCCQCQGIETIFNRKTARKELKKYRKKGPEKATAILIEALKSEGIDGMTLLDIGGGVGAVQHELLKSGAMSATSVEASTAYLEVAKEEAERQSHAERVSFQHGNFVDLASVIAPADIVTLDKVICCYHDMHGLVGLSAARARKLYGLVYPRETWWNKIFDSVVNFYLWVSRKQYRSFLHRTEAVDSVVRENGMEQRFYRKTVLWQVVVYSRKNASDVPRNA